MNIRDKGEFILNKLQNFQEIFLKQMRVLCMYRRLKIILLQRELVQIRL
jgi:hypothetical protein